MEKFYVRELSSGEIVLVSEDWQIGTHQIHKEIWKENYLNMEVLEGENFSTKEKHIEGDYFCVIANPIISSKKRPS